MRACFFARVRDPALFDVVEFYRSDIVALKELGFEVVTATSFREIPWDADLYFTWWWGPGIRTLIKSIPARRPNIFSGTLQLAPELDWWKRLGPLRRSIVRACLRLATANVAISRVELQYLESLGARRPHLVHCGVDTDFYRPPQHSHGAREKLIVTVSHLTSGNVARKRLETVIRAIPQVLREHPDARFAMIGGHEDGYDPLVTLAHELGVSPALSFPGRVSTPEKLAFYQRARVLAQATVYEGFGVSIAEAMACGLPVVTSPRGSLPEVVGDCGRFVEPDDADGMAREISALLAEPAAAQALGLRARARVEERYSRRVHRQALARVISSVLPSWCPPADR